MFIGGTAQTDLELVRNMGEFFYRCEAVTCEAMIWIPSDATIEDLFAIAAKHLASPPHVGLVPDRTRWTGVHDAPVSQGWSKDVEGS